MTVRFYLAKVLRFNNIFIWCKLVNAIMDKIPIKKISKNIYQQKGFPSGPFNACLTCKCGKTRKGCACCEEGVYVDKKSYDFIIKHKKYFEQKIGIKIEKCFDKRWPKDPEYLG